jgi:hypothetical protein
MGKEEVGWWIKEREADLMVFGVWCLVSCA